MITPVHGTAYGIRADGEGVDPVGNVYSEDWHTVMVAGADGWAPLRRYPSEAEAIGYVENQVRAKRARNTGV